MEPQNLVPQPPKYRPYNPNITSSPEPLVDANTSGQGVPAVMPPGVAGWSWGAFGFTWIWGLFNGTYIALLALIPAVNIIMMFVLGFKGREWAWRNKQWESVDRFNRVQRTWSMVWLILIGVLILLWIVGMGSALILPSVKSVKVVNTTANGSVTTTYETAGDAANDAKIQGVLDEMRVAASIYEKNHGNYGSPTNSCSSGMFIDSPSGISAILNSSGYPPNTVFDCVSNGTAWAVSISLPTGGYWCSDSTNKSASTNVPLGTNTSCQL